MTVRVFEESAPIMPSHGRQRMTRVCSLVGDSEGLPASVPGKLDQFSC